MTNYLSAALTPDTVPQDVLDAAVALVQKLPRERFRGGFCASCAIPDAERNALLDLSDFIASAPFIDKLKAESKIADLIPGERILRRREPREYPGLTTKAGGHGGRHAAFRCQMVLSGAARVELRGRAVKADLPLSPGLFLAVKVDGALLKRFVVDKPEPLVTLDMMLWGPPGALPGERPKAMLLGN